MNNTNTTPANPESQEKPILDDAKVPELPVNKKPNPNFPLRRPGLPARGPIMGRGRGGGMGNKGRIGMRTGTR